jgi:hypothetical protein
VHQSSLAILPAQPSNVKQEERAKGIMNLDLRNIFVRTSNVISFLHSAKSYDIGHPALLPIRRKACCGFLSPLKTIALAGVKTWNLGSSIK